MEKEFEEIINSVNENLTWRKSTKSFQANNNYHARIFVLTPEWEGYFYMEVLVKAFSNIYPYPVDTDPPDMKYMARLIVSSGRASAIDIQGPYELKDKALHRQKMLMDKFDMPYLPDTLSEIQSMALAVGCFATKD